MKECSSCGSANFEQANFCEQCGSRFAVNSGDNATDVPAYSPPPTSEVIDVASPAIGIAPEPAETVVDRAPAPEPQAPGQNDAPPETSEKAIRGAKLVIERGDRSGIEFVLGTSESTIGRWDADNGVFPDIDLDQHDADAKVSRRHARVKFVEGRYFIEDLGSTNGTYINRGRRLLPGNIHELHDGDEVIVGKTFLRFQTVTE